MLLQRLLDEGPVVDDVGLAEHVHDERAGDGHRLLPPVRVERVQLLSTRGLQGAEATKDQFRMYVLFWQTLNLFVAFEAFEANHEGLFLTV